MNTDNSFNRSAPQQRAVIIYSGGMDSFTLLHKILKEDKALLFPLCIDYGQKHNKEILAARRVCDNLRLPLKILNLQHINQLFSSSSLTGSQQIPEGTYNEDNMRSTVVPNRNMILLSLAIGYAADIGAQQVYYGAHSGDHALYPDCRPAFVEAMNTVSKIANYEPISIEVPFLHFTKGQILSEGLAMGLNYQDTWTCYNGRSKACGHCGACQERLEAFATNNAVDPVEYEA